MANNIIKSDDATLTTNIDTSALDSAKKFIGAAHGLSMIALSMLDISHNTLKAVLSFNSSDILTDTSLQLMSVWLKCDSNRVLLKSVKVNGVFQSTYFKVALSDNDSKPMISSEFPPGISVIVTAEITDEYHLYKFYRWNEPFPRELTLALKEN